MTTSIEFDAVSNFSDEHATVSEQPISGVISGVQVAQASGGQTAPAAGEPVPVDVGSGAPAKGDGNAQNAQSTATLLPPTPLPETRQHRTRQPRTLRMNITPRQAMS
ncbi:hypothetical protein [Mesorhizobium sp.]|uniref:hypothetical protein n=1 Tax=Mesorhizobium sp. TaxID=1871066 RepID=UPI000FEAA6F1|nr:hypothetical protein [Mesorhizobium sp.]RWG28646.1 MAG: hypothetical protein EOQ60_22800 [Mesorhizobium sp.]